MLNLLFAPRGIAVIGASRDRTKLGYGVARNLVASNYPGAIPFASEEELAAIRRQELEARRPFDLLEGDAVRARGHHLDRDGPDEAEQLARDRGHDLTDRFPPRRQVAVALVQPVLRLPGDLHDDGTEPALPSFLVLP